VPPPDRRALWDLIAASGLPPGRFVADADGRVPLLSLADATSLDTGPDHLRGRCVLISSQRQLPAVLALAELDGIARRLVLCPPDLAAEHIPAVMADAGIDAIVSDGTGPAADTPCAINARIRPGALRPAPRYQSDHETEWLLFTSGTTGRPKMVVHTLASLIGPLDDGLGMGANTVWSTFYDMRRYGGLTILMRAVVLGGSMVLSQAGEPLARFLARAAAARVTHISGTPSHWRRALMSPAVARFTPGYVRLSGEVADQTILDTLRAAFPGAAIAHAYASTEAGVGFDVRDGLAGFPASYVGQPGAKVELKVQGGSLRLRSARTARHFADGRPLAEPDGFVDSGDMVELRDGRYYFIGRREGIINVGGRKVHPEEVEAVILRHQAVRMARVRARASPITGALVAADVVLRAPEGADEAAIAGAIIELCRSHLPAHMVPVTVQCVPALEIAASGKLARPRA
jgi:acyl-CoA synthetase (AMP-forming)/AMP-acid ligase II